MSKKQFPIGIYDQLLNAQQQRKLDEERGVVVETDSIQRRKCLSSLLYLQLRLKKL